MKLRNKKTGEIGDLMGSERSCPYIGIGIDFHDGNPKAYYYNSLAELNEEWEDYKPAESLIKDEKIRNMIRTWAEYNLENSGVKSFYFMRVFQYEHYWFVRVWFNKSYDIYRDIEVQGKLENMNKGDVWECTIDELCGEEE